MEEARESGVKLRVSGQRHSQPPLVAEDNRSDPPRTARTWLLDLSCYADLGLEGNQQIELDAENKTVTVNAGVREDYLDAFLTANDLMLPTVTAGGFFSLGGMTAVDVHGATVDSPIFAETVSAFTLMGADGKISTIGPNDPGIDGWKAIQFARVSLGTLGIVTSMTLEVMDRPWATSVRSGRKRYSLKSEDRFVRKYRKLLSQHARIESFYDPYSSRFLVFSWDLESSPSKQIPNPPANVPSSARFAQEKSFGAPYEEGLLEPLAEGLERWGQLAKSRLAARGIMEVSFREAESLFDRAGSSYANLWLTRSARVAFMSYFVELPRLDEDGLRKVWQALRVVADRLDGSKDFLVTAPLEFRFIKGGDSALSGTYATSPDSTFVNLDLIAFVKHSEAADYSPQMLQFFADVERVWYGAFGGLPHNGKMYGFHDPGAGPGTSTPPFAPGFLQDLQKRRGVRLEAFETFRKRRDPSGLFSSDFLRVAFGLDRKPGSEG